MRVVAYREELISDCRLILGDCRDILPTIGKVDAVVTDPPYGINIAANPVRQAHAKMSWDNSVPSDDVLQSLILAGDTAIIWGGNYFNLPPNQCFLVWDKLQPHDFSLAMCEQAWTNKGGPAKMHRQSVTSYQKDHPTQKPVELMIWCLDFLPEAKAILDPFMGSGTTGVACVKRGKSFIGIEREAAYFEISLRRIEEAYKQPDFFVSAPEPKAVQPSMFEGDA